MWAILLFLALLTPKPDCDIVWEFCVEDCEATLEPPLDDCIEVCNEIADDCWALDQDDRGL